MSSHRLKCKTRSHFACSRSDAALAENSSQFALYGATISRRGLNANQWAPILLTPSEKA